MEIKHELENNKGIFFIELNNEVLAEMTYTKFGHNTMIIEHTEVSDKLAHQGIGKKLVDNAVEYARAHDMKIHPLCPFAKKVLERGPEYKDVLV